MRSPDWKMCDTSPSASFSATSVISISRDPHRPSTARVHVGRLFDARGLFGFGRSAGPAALRGLRPGFVGGQLLSLRSARRR